MSYLAAGGIQGLRPLRYEKRVARNRFIFFVIILFLLLLGTLLVFLKGHRVKAYSSRRTTPAALASAVPLAVGDFAPNGQHQQPSDHAKGAMK